MPTKEPLLKEYSVAAHVSPLPVSTCESTQINTVFRHPGKIYKLSQGSLAELTRNSVIQSGFEMEVKRHWPWQTLVSPRCRRQWYRQGAPLPSLYANDFLIIAYEHRQTFPISD
jgi:hypothetical protein